MGCRLNIAESEAIRSGLDPAEPVVIINSCAVTSEAMAQTRKAVRRASRENPAAKIIVTGCAAQVDPAMFAAMDEVTRVVGNLEKRDPAAFRFDTPDTERVRVADIMAVETHAPHLASSFAEHSRGFLEIQNGCDHRCTFCIIPYGRGNSRSVPAGSVIDGVRAQLDKGISEVVLTGVDLTSYGHDLPGSPSLGLLVERILNAVPELPRLRLSSLDGVEIDDRLFALITQESRILPHVHLSLQHGHDMILKRMKRRHSRAQAVDLVQRLHAARPDIAIGADLIAGFPTEDDDMHAANLALLDDCRIVHAHIFPYSPRPGTPAARMPQVPVPLIKARAAALRARAATLKARWLASLMGSVQTILIEGDGSGLTGQFARVVPDAVLPRGTLADVRISEHEGDILRGALLNKAELQMAEMA